MRDKNGYIRTGEEQALLDAIRVLSVARVQVRLETGNGSAEDYLVNAIWHVQDRLMKVEVEV